VFLEILAFCGSSVLVCMKEKTRAAFSQYAVDRSLYGYETWFCCLLPSTAWVPKAFSAGMHECDFARKE
jgi:hypothetical protein